jgi:hypothetical protein
MRTKIRLALTATAGVVTLSIAVLAVYVAADLGSCVGRLLPAIHRSTDPVVIQRGEYAGGHGSVQEAMRQGLAQMRAHGPENLPPPYSPDCRAMVWTPLSPWGRAGRCAASDPRTSARSKCALLCS